MYSFIQNLTFNVIVYVYHIVLITGGLSGLYITVLVTNLSVHSTYIVVYHFHYILSLTLVLTVIVLVYLSGVLRFTSLYAIVLLFALGSIHSRRVYTHITAPTTFNYTFASLVTYSGRKPRKVPLKDRLITLYEATENVGQDYRHTADFDMDFLKESYKEYSDVLKRPVPVFDDDSFITRITVTREGYRYDGNYFEPTEPNNSTADAYSFTDDYKLPHRLIPVFEPNPLITHEFSASTPGVIPLYLYRFRPLRLVAPFIQAYLFVNQYPTVIDGAYPLTAEPDYMYLRINRIYDAEEYERVRQFTLLQFPYPGDYFKSVHDSDRADYIAKHFKDRGIFNISKGIMTPREDIRPSSAPAKPRSYLTKIKGGLRKIMDRFRRKKWVYEGYVLGEIGDEDLS